MSEYIMNRESLKRHCEAMCEKFKDVSTSGTYGEHRLVLDLLEQTEWIPIKEKQPQDHDWYLIVVKEKSTGYQYIPRVATYLHDNCWCIIDTEDANEDWLNDLECIAWMPLPMPYKAKSEDCRNCKKWEDCSCGKDGYENGTSQCYSIGECRDFKPKVESEANNG